MKRFGQIEIITAVIIIVISLAGPALAVISWSGDVIPSDPSTWDLSTDGAIGFSGNGTMGITGGSDVIDNVGIIGDGPGSTGAVTVDGAGSTWTNSFNLTVGWYGNGTLNITGGGTVSNGIGSDIGFESGSTGEVTVDGAGSTLTNNFGFRIGIHGNGTLNITNGGAVSSGNCYTSGDSGSASEVTVDGAGSTWTNNGQLYVGGYGNGTLNITDNGLVSVAGSLAIDYFDIGDSFVNMSTGGMLAILGDADDSLVEFLGLIDGTDAIRYWDSSIAGWADITGATLGIDYTLEYLTEGDLAGYTMLTVPEPATLFLLGLGGLMLRRKRS